MLDGWYCRSLANEQGGTGGHSQQDDDENEPNVPDSGSDDSQDQESNMHIPHPDYKQQIKYLKQKLKFLFYENEFFQDALRTSQRRLLKVSRDRSFLLDRLLQYEKPEGSSSESEETESSDDERSKIEAKKRKYDTQSTSNKNQGPATKKKKTTQQKQKNSSNANQSQSQQQQHQQLQQQQLQHQQQQQQQQIQEGHMTAEEVERHLQSRQTISELMPERAPPTVPTEMFSNEPSLDSESNDQVIETSPSNIGEDCVGVSDMNVKNEFIKTEFIKTEFIKTEYQS